MPWDGGYVGTAAASAANAVFLGGEPRGWLRYSIDTGFNVPSSLAFKGLYGARLEVTGLGLDGSAPAAGQYACDFESDVELVFGAPFFVSGAAANLASDPLARPTGVSRLHLLIRMRPVRVPDLVSSVSVQTVNFAIYRLT